jgi:hypothetical protein
MSKRTVVTTEVYDGEYLVERVTKETYERTEDEKNSEPTITNPNPIRFIGGVSPNTDGYTTYNPGPLTDSTSSGSFREMYPKGDIEFKATGRNLQEVTTKLLDALDNDPRAR